MEKISRKEAFDHAVVFTAAVINAINEKKRKLYDYALIVLKYSSQPIICLEPGELFQWNGSKAYQEKSYAFIPIGHPYVEEAALKQCGSNHERDFGSVVSFEKFKACLHPCSWIKNTLAYQYMELIYVGDMLFSNKLEYDSSLFFSKIHSTWIRAQVDEITIFFPYYSATEKKQILSKLPRKFYTDITQKFWND